MSKCKGDYTHPLKPVSGWHTRGTAGPREALASLCHPLWHPRGPSARHAGTACQHMMERPAHRRPRRQSCMLCQNTSFRNGQPVLRARAAACTLARYWRGGLLPGRRSASHATPHATPPPHGAIQRARSGHARRTRDCMAHATVSAAACHPHTRRQPIPADWRAHTHWPTCPCCHAAFTHRQAAGQRVC